MAKYMVKERFVKNHTIYEVVEIFELIKLPKPVDKYKEKYDTIIVVAHKMAFQSICDCGDMKPAEIFETTF